MQSNQQLVTWSISFLLFHSPGMPYDDGKPLRSLIAFHATLLPFHHIAVLSPRWNWLRAKIDPATYMLSRSSIRKRSKVKKTHWKTKFASSGGKFTFGNEEIILYIICISHDYHPSIYYTSSWTASQLCYCQIHKIVMAKNMKSSFVAKLAAT